MDRKRLDYLHSTCLDYGQWATGGRDRVGIQACWPDIPHRSLAEGVTGHRRATKAQKSHYPRPQPHSSRNKPQARPLTGRIETQFSEIHGIAVRLPEPIKFIVVFMYYKAMPFRDVCLVTGLESKKVGRLKYRFLESIDSVL